MFGYNKKPFKTGGKIMRYSSGEEILKDMMRLAENFGEGFLLGSTEAPVIISLSGDYGDILTKLTKLTELYEEAGVEANALARNKEFYEEMPEKELFEMKGFVGENNKHMWIIPATGVKPEDIEITAEDNFLFIRGCSEYDFCEEPFYVHECIHFEDNYLDAIVNKEFLVEIKDGLVKIEYQMMANPLEKGKVLVRRK